MENNLTKLEHYTNIDSLEKILESKSIKFNALKNMNDKLEGKARDYMGFDNIIFCSSWTKDSSKKGRKYMWDNYTKKETGVRITMPSNPFKLHKYRGDGILECESKTILPPKYFSVLVPNDLIEFNQLLNKVVYTDDIENCFPKVVSEDFLKINKLGLHKTTEWKPEKEWRYLLRCIPRKCINFNKESLEVLLKSIDIDEIFIDLKDEIIPNIEVTASPTLNKNNIEKLLDIGNEYNIKINIDYGKA